MKRQVLKIENGYMFSVIHDDEAVRDEAYRLYYHTERRNRNYQHDGIDRSLYQHETDWIPHSY